MIRSSRDHIFFKKIFSKLDFLKTVLVTIIANSEKMKMKKSYLAMTFALAIPEKNKQGRGGLRTYLFENPLQFLGFLLYPWKFKNKTKDNFTPKNSTKLCYTSRKF